MINLNIPNADFFIVENFLDTELCDELLRFYTKEMIWEHYKINDKNIPRLNISYGLAYSYSGIKHVEKDVPEIYVDLGNKISEIAGLEKDYFNSYLLNYYRTSKDRIGLHSDSEKGLGDNPIVASISLGATRTFILKENRTGKTFKIPLVHNTVMLMGDKSQINYRHGIDEEKGKEPRVSITFRRIL